MERKFSVKNLKKVLSALKLNVIRNFKRTLSKTLELIL